MVLNEKIRDFVRYYIINPLIYLGIVSLLFFLGEYVLLGKTGFNEIVNALIITPIMSLPTADSMITIIIVFGILLVPFGIAYLVYRSLDFAIMTILSIVATCVERDLNYLKELATEDWRWFAMLVLVIGLRIFNPITEIASAVILGFVGIYAFCRFTIVAAIIVLEAISCNKPYVREEFNPPV